MAKVNYNRGPVAQAKAPQSLQQGVPIFLAEQGGDSADQSPENWEDFQQFAFSKTEESALSANQDTEAVRATGSIAAPWPRNF